MTNCEQGWDGVLLSSSEVSLFILVSLTLPNFKIVKISYFHLMIYTGFLLRTDKIIAVPSYFIWTLLSATLAKSVRRGLGYRLKPSQDLKIQIIQPKTIPGPKSGISKIYKMISSKNMSLHFWIFKKDWLGSKEYVKVNFKDKIGQILLLRGKSQVAFIWCI